MSLPNVKLVDNNASRSGADSIAIAGKSNTFLDSYIYMKNSRYNALYEKNKDILQIENYAINQQNAEYLYDAFLEHVRVLETVVTRMRNFAFRIKSDVVTNLRSIIPDAYEVNKFDESITNGPDIPNFKYVHYKIKSIDYANLSVLSSMFEQELKELTSSNKVAGGTNAMPKARCTDFIEQITANYKTSYDGLLNMEEIKMMTSSRRNIIVNFYKQKNSIITSVIKDFRTYHVFLKQFIGIIKACDKLEPKNDSEGNVIINGTKISFTDYVTIYKHFSTMMKDLLDLVGHYDNLFYNKIYALQSNIEVYNSIIKYSINYAEAKTKYNNDENKEIPIIESVLFEAYWDGFMNSDTIDAHNLINGNYATQELLWDTADELYDEDEEFLDDISEPLEEGATTEKISSFAKDKYLTILSYIKDIYRKWVGIKSIHVSDEEYKLIHSICASSKILIDYLLEILRTGNPISYEVKYEEFMNEVKQFKKARKNSDKSKFIAITTLHDEVKKLEKALHESTKSKVENANKYRTALWNVISRALYVINCTLYNASGKGQGNTSRSVVKSGISSKRYGKKGFTGLSLNKLDDSDITPLLSKLRSESSYSSYKKVFDEVCEAYGKENISALKLLDLTKHNKLVFVGYSRLKPMIIKAGTKLYHISPSDSITQLEPKFKSKDNITFYSNQRIYFTDKMLNPKRVLGNIDKPSIYEFTTTSDLTAYRDSEYGSWYHNCIYIETNKPISVKNITDEVMVKYEKPQNESIEWQDYYDLSILNESISEEMSDVKEKLDTEDKGTLGCTENQLNKICTKYESLSNEEKVKKMPIMLSILNKVLDTMLYITGIGFVRGSVVAYKDDKEFMHDIKREMPMNHETYNKIYSAIFFKSILRIICSVILSIASLAFIGVGISKTSMSSLNGVANKCTKLGSKLPPCKSLCDRIVSVIGKILPIGTVVESCEYINLYDGDTDIEIQEDKIDNKNIDDNELKHAEDDLPIKEDTAWLQDTGEEVGPICTVRSSIVS